MFMYLKVNQFAVMFAHALLLHLSKDFIDWGLSLPHWDPVIVPSCICDEAVNLISLLSERGICFFSALHGTLAWIGMRKVRLSILPSVQDVDCDKTEEKSV